MAAEWIARYNIQSCSSFPLPVHVTLPEIVQARRLQAQLLMQGQVTLVVLAMTVIVATILVVTALMRGWRGSSHRRVAVPA